MGVINKGSRGCAFWFGLTLLLIQTAVPAEADMTELTERIEWHKRPIRLELTVGQERRVEFPDAVQVGIPGALQPLLRTQSVNGTVYLLAHQDFKAVRIMVKEIERGQLYLFDVVASETGGQTHPVQVFVKDSGEASISSSDDGAPAQLGYVTLTRFAAQQLYAPVRLMHNVPGIRRIPVARDPIGLVRGGAIHATPLVAWRAGGYYLTAVKLTNRSDQPQVLDPRDLRGDWLTATFQHNRLLPAGDEADTTAVYLISARPFAVAF